MIWFIIKFLKHQHSQRELPRLLHLFIYYNLPSSNLRSSSAAADGTWTGHRARGRRPLRRHDQMSRLRLFFVRTQFTLLNFFLPHGTNNCLGSRARARAPLPPGLGGSSQTIINHHFSSILINSIMETSSSSIETSLIHLNCRCPGPSKHLFVLPSRRRPQPGHGAPRIGTEPLRRSRC